MDFIDCSGLWVVGDDPNAPVPGVDSGARFARRMSMQEIAEYFGDGDRRKREAWLAILLVILADD